MPSLPSKKNFLDGAKKPLTGQSESLYMTNNVFEIAQMQFTPKQLHQESNHLMKTNSPRNRRLRAMYLAAGLAALVLSSSAVLGANVTWDGTTTGDWADGNNWVGGNPPTDNTTSDDAYFTGTGTYTVSLAANRSARRLYVTGSANPVFDFGDYTLNAPSLANIQGGSASLVSGTISTIWYQGYRASDATFTVEGSTAKISGTGGLIGEADSTQNANSNTLIIMDGGDFESTSGTFILGRANTATANVTANNNKVEVTGTGSTFSASGIHIGRTAGVGTGLQANNNSLVVNDGGVASTQLLYVGYQSSGNTSTGNTVTIGGSGTGSALNLLTSANNPSLHVGFGGATDNVVAVNAGGEINANGQNLRVYGGTGNKLRVFGGAINDAGTILIQGNGGRLYLGAAGSITANTITVEAGGRFGDKSDAANAGFTSGTLSLTTMNYSPTALFSVGDNSGTNPAIYNMVGGVHSFGGGITIEQSDGRLTGNGTIQGLSGADTTLTVNGVLAPGNSVGTINVTGDVVSGANAVFNFEIGSLVSFDQLLVSGDIAFNGTLNLSLLDGYIPEVGNSFQLFDFTSSSGAFGTLNLASLGGDKTWDVSNLYSTGFVQVAAIPEPSTSLGLLVMSGLFACAGWLFRRA